MKISSLLFLLSVFAVGAVGQTGQGAAPRVIAELAAKSDSLVKGSPFSAEAVSESVQTLADGNRIVRKWNNKLYRNSEGRLRREGSGIGGAGLGVFTTGGSAVTIHDPNGGYRYFLDVESKIARPMTVVTPRAARLPEGVNLPSGLALKAQTETDVARGAEVKAAAAARIAAGAMVQGHFACETCGKPSKYDTKTESLGMQSFDGVEAEGTRTITTIPADAIGNERPIEIVYEKWYSNELQMIVYSKHSDPRFGEQTYRLTNINRSEPDPSLFELPRDYKIMTDPGTRIHQTAPTRVSTRPTRVTTIKNATSAGSRP